MPRRVPELVPFGRPVIDGARGPRNRPSADRWAITGMVAAAHVALLGFLLTQRTMIQDLPKREPGESIVVANMLPNAPVRPAAPKVDLAIADVLAAPLVPTVEVIPSSDEIIETRPSNPALASQSYDPFAGAALPAVLLASAPAAPVQQGDGLAVRPVPIGTSGQSPLVDRACVGSERDVRLTLDIVIDDKGVIQSVMDIASTGTATIDKPSLKQAIVGQAVRVAPGELTPLGERRFHEVVCP